MEKLKELYTKYINYIVAILFILVCLKGCQTCNLKNRSKYTGANYIQQLDSLKKTIIIIENSSRKSIDSMQSIIDIQRVKIENAERTINELKDTNKKTSSTLNNVLEINKKILTNEKSE